MVHLLVLLVIDLVEEFLPVVVEVEEEFIVVEHLGLSVQDHGSGLTEVLNSINPLTHAVVVESLANIFKDVHAVDDERLAGLEEDLPRVEESLSHALDLLVVMMVNLTVVVKHVAYVGGGGAKLVDGLGGLLVRSIPASAHCVLGLVVGSHDAELSTCVVAIGRQEEDCHAELYLVGADGESGADHRKGRKATAETAEVCAFSSSLNDNCAIYEG